MERKALEVLSTALSQFIKNCNKKPSHEEQIQIDLAQGMLDQFDAALANV
jgi:hypothetical protein